MEPQTEEVSLPEYTGLSTSGTQNDILEYITSLLVQNGGKMPQSHITKKLKQNLVMKAQVGKLTKFVEQKYPERFIRVKENGMYIIYLRQPGQKQEQTPDIHLQELTHVFGEKQAQFRQSLSEAAEELVTALEKEEENLNLDNMMITNTEESEDWSMGLIDQTEAEICEEWKAIKKYRKVSQTYQKLKKFRKELPAYLAKQTIIEAVRTHAVTILFADTGGGKSTQVPQFILDDCLARGQTCSVMVTQPRRISALSVAKRVADERDEQLGSGAVGYKVRFEQAVCEKTKVAFVTQGILLRRLQRDPTLVGVTHVIIDEIHERDCLTDFSLLLLKNLVTGPRPDLKLILMSATMDSKTFEHYFTSGKLQPKVLSIPGKIFPVEEMYLVETIRQIGFYPFANIDAYLATSFNKNQTQALRDAYRKDVLALQGQVSGVVKGLPEERLLCSLHALIRRNDTLLQFVEKLIFWIHENKDEGAILVFVPGWSQISELCSNIEPRLKRLRPGEMKLFQLHSQVPLSQQTQVFQPYQGRKLIIATNIAETSITIDDVVYVIDLGLVKEVGYNPVTGISSLLSVRESLANAKQRRGRAGRVKPGTIYYCFSRKEAEKMSEYQLPEMMRMPVEEICMHVRALETLRDMSVPNVLAHCIDPPDVRAVSNAVDLLRGIGLFDSNEMLTTLGKKVVRIPVHPQLGKMLVVGSLLGCLSPILTVMAVFGSKSVWTLDSQKRDLTEAKRRFANNSVSDHLAQVEAYDQWLKASRAGEGAFFCRQNCLNQTTLQMVQKTRQQFQKLLGEIGLGHVSVHSLDRNSDKPGIVRMVLVACLYPNLVRLVSPGSGRPKLTLLQTATNIALHPASVNRGMKQFKYPWLVYHEIVKTDKKVFLYDSSMISTVYILMFVRNIHRVPYSNNVLQLGDNLASFRVGSRGADAVMLAHDALWKLFNFDRTTLHLCPQQVDTLLFLLIRANELEASTAANSSTNTIPTSSNSAAAGSGFHYVTKVPPHMRNKSSPVLQAHNTPASSPSPTDGGTRRSGPGGARGGKRRRLQKNK